MTPSQRYRADLARTGFHADSGQLQVVELLQTLYERLQQHRCGRAWRRWWTRSRPPEGLYIWGGPGRGKTYLMDCFFDCLAFADKRRVHFHRFMLEVHSALDALPRTPDPLEIVAAQMAERYRVLCLDEFHVTDVADAMLLSGLLDGMFKRGLVLVATSNTPPQDLYLHGLQRERFLPAIALLDRCTQVVGLGGGPDFRLEHLESSGTYRVIDAADGEAWLQLRLKELAPVQHQFDTVLEIAGRSLQVRARAEDVVWFSFSELCQRPRSTGDYLELAREYHTLLLQGVPSLGDEQDEAVRRFIHLVDALYDHGVKLVVTSAEVPGRLYTGTRLSNAFQRTASRLTEMSGTAYLTRAHRVD
jgi:cell division protein ZapE